MIFRYNPQIHFDSHFWNQSSCKEIPWPQKNHFRSPIFISQYIFIAIHTNSVDNISFELKNHIKNSLAPKFSKLDFYKPIHLEISRRVSSSPAIDTLLLFQKGSDKSTSMCIHRNTPTNTKIRQQTS